MRKEVLLLCLLLCSCSAQKKEDILPLEEKKEEKVSEKADIDLSFGSQTVAYAAVSDILENPEDYLGKRVRMLGTYRKFDSETYGYSYYVCMVQDATACCQQGMEFSLAEGKEYPLEGQQIILEGIVDVYPEGNAYYAYLKDADYKVY